MLRSTIIWRKPLRGVAPAALVILAVSLSACRGHDPQRREVLGNDCYVCHQPEFEATTAPPHDGIFSTACGGCHLNDAWVPAVPVQHDWFALENRHSEAACADCHTSGYRPGDTPSECVGCHRADYDASPYPNHQTFPTTCADCHTTSGWTPALAGAHPEARFPIRTGPHQYECASCHDAARGAATGGMNTNCVGCHDGVHTRALMDEKHREVSRYPAGTTSVNFCLNCHPSGANGD